MGGERGGAGAGVLALFLGVSVWRELAQAPGAVMRTALIGALLVLVAIGTFALAMEKVPAAAQVGLLHLDARSGLHNE